MIWCAIGYTGKTPICIVSTKMDAAYYINLLDCVLANSGDDYFGPDYIFQQDKAAIHTAKLTIAFLADHNIPLLEDWPPCSPDLNPIENVWGLLAKNVYKNGRQFESVKHLRDALISEWNKIDQESLQSFINSMPRRIQQVILNKGGNTNY